MISLGINKGFGTVYIKMNNLVSEIITKIITHYAKNDLSYKGTTHQIQQKAIIESSALNQDTVTIINRQFNKATDNNDIKDEGGVYIFVAANDFNLSVKETFDISLDLEIIYIPENN